MEKSREGYFVFHHQGFDGDRWMTQISIQILVVGHLFRYTSPTDMMMSPVTKGLLAINKKGGALLPPGPGKYQPKVPDMCLQDLSPLQNKLPMLIDEKLNST
ncbi:uncharacterized protein [Medicago truncatula]|uniref:uncharacterized protein isoform X2 n=1 Tax=Medicago truncatula TaxID=3880 RepID=UPI001967971D|nr:uncharacterized protein LOC11422532 isoform X2 [Medicago truncatula]